MAGVKTWPLCERRSLVPHAPRVESPISKRFWVELPYLNLSPNFDPASVPNSHGCSSQESRNWDTAAERTRQRISRPSDQRRRDLLAFEWCPPTAHQPRTEGHSRAPAAGSRVPFACHVLGVRAWISKSPQRSPKTASRIESTPEIPGPGRRDASSHASTVDEVRPLGRNEWVRSLPD